MKYVTTFILVCCALVIWSQSEYSRVKVDLTTTSIYELSRLGIEVDHGIHYPHKQFINDLSKEQILLLKENGFEVEIVIADVKDHYRMQNHEGHHHEYDAHLRNGAPCDGGGDVTTDYMTPENYTYGSMGGYHTYLEMLTVLDSMQAKFPHLISIKDTVADIHTHEGRPIHWLRVSDNPNVDEDEPEVLYTALHHAREANSISQMIFYLWYLLENYDKNAQIKFLVDNTEMYFVPCVNPDGYVYNQRIDPDGGGLWRKNRYVNELNDTVGVDLNRNYGFEWGIDDTGSSPDENSDTYRGPGPFSEPETQAIRDFANEHSFVTALNYHTYGNLLIHPWGFNDMPTAEDDIFKALAGVMTTENDYLVGTGTETVGYVVNGDSDDWMYGETTTKPKIYAMTPEVGPGSFGFWPPSSVIDDLNKDALRMNIMNAQLVHGYAELIDNSPKILNLQSGSISFSIRNSGLSTNEFSVSVTTDAPEVELTNDVSSYMLENLQSADFTFDYQILDSESQEIMFTVSIDYGAFVQELEITKQYVSGDYQMIWSDADNDLSLWNIDGSWSITDNDFTSEPFSFTDSPGGAYSNNTLTGMTLRDPISLEDQEEAILRYNARWDIEQGWDYAQLQISTDGVDWVSQCATNTVIGNDDQDEGEPLYSGVQSEWSAEEVSLSDYIGEEIYLRWRLVTDQFVTGDGIYIDDMRIEAVSAEPSSTADVYDISSVSINPNPVRDLIDVSYKLAKSSSTVSITVHDHTGRVVQYVDLGDRISGTHLHQLNVEMLSAGLYFIYIKADGVISEGHKIVKL